LWLATNYVLCVTVVALLEAKQATYEIKDIGIAEKPHWFLDASPHSKVLRSFPQIVCQHLFCADFNY